MLNHHILPRYSCILLTYSVQRYCLGMSDVAAMAILSEYTPAIMEWCETYMKKEPVTGSGEIEFKR